MRSCTLSVSLALVTLAACSQSRSDPRNEMEALRARSEAVVAAEMGRDTDRALSFWAEDAIVQPAGAPQIQGHDAIRALYGHFFSPQLKDFNGTRSQLILSEGGDLAYEYGINRITMAGPQGELLDVGKYLTVWRKVKGEWYIVALSFTSDAPAPLPVSQ